MNQERLHRWWNKLIPPRCCLCRAAGHDGLDLCSECLADLPQLGPCCSTCADSLTASNDDASSSCGRCQQQPPHFDQVMVAFPYAQPLDHFVTQLKFARQMAYGRLLAQLMLRALPAERRLPDRFMPVPLHPRRLAQRGFNQATIIAKQLGAALRIKVDNASLHKLRQTTPQVELDARTRRGNLRGAFGLSKRFKAADRIALVDDVMTTGATANELAKLLKQAGVAQVDVWVCARA